MVSIPDIYGKMVFDDCKMKEYMSPEIYAEMKRLMGEGKHLSPEVSEGVAKAMKEWAIEMGATHYTHWFQPLTGITAEKHDSFLERSGESEIIMDFSGKALIKGESDASSFPSGGLRATFEARGYTAWDPTSFAFIKDGTLCIPTAFCSYGGAALDKKTPLLRSMEALEKQAKRLLKIIGSETDKILVNVGAEQEYFIVDREVFDRRPDLISCGRTLIGAKPNKGQELDDHYYGAIKPRVSAFMKELDSELWKLGVPVKTEHNEVAPSQHELAPIFETANIATDHNQLIMEFLKRIADRHGMVCLLHEKPFAGVNGSGKHNNWSLSTGSGENLLSPGHSPATNIRFLLFLTAMIRAVHKHQDLLRASAVSAGNDHRLGGSEAPPTVISVFLGTELSGVIDSIINDSMPIEANRKNLEIGASVMPKVRQDVTDRNRTSPFAFTGNKFEFRMPGSSVSVAGINTVINTIFAESLSDFADEIAASADPIGAAFALVKRELKAHRDILFDGNNYSEEWVAEAKRRGLLQIRSTADCMGYYDSDSNISLFEKFHVMSGTEIHARKEIYLENYSKTVNVEGLTLLEMLRRDIIPSCIRFEDRLSMTGEQKIAFMGEDCAGTERKLLKKVSDKVEKLDILAEQLESALSDASAEKNSVLSAEICRDSVIPCMESIRSEADELESIVDRRFWPYPSYNEILYSVK